MDISVKNLQKKILLQPKQISLTARKILLREGIKTADLSITFVSSQKIRALNKKFLKRPYATDVLAFDLNTDELPSQQKRPRLAGEVIISTDAIKQNARRFKTSLKNETYLYVIHGILHLLGYDDQNPKEKQKMQNKEKELMDYLK